MSSIRFIVSGRPAVGQIVLVRLLIQHPMETGYRFDVDGRRIERNAIRLVVCEFDGLEVFRVEPSSGISANPLFEFPFRVARSGQWLVRWQDEAGAQGEWRQAMKVE
jgi:sulfur-oxidizing protein SoxZ